MSGPVFDKAFPLAALFSPSKSPPLTPALEADRWHMRSPQGQATWASRGCGVEGSWARCGGLEQAGDACSVQRHRVTVARCPPGTENGWLPALPIIKGKSVNRISVGVQIHPDFPCLQLFIFLFLSFKSFVYFGLQSFIRYVFFKCFLPVCVLEE